ncbi:unnamed protein product [Zymoseptoria tritici ST99CH_3D7]|uniref:Uncharacterized protein n=1 Tax=Zymoseptoria tritici (strain ST99CH_3D7) TaxID=1276538 RepID=A0A1X7RZY9_ZYMT9|nr:unnamed protein product [Zymoseptoria tritici ST99CH_3D7]
MDEASIQREQERAELERERQESRSTLPGHNVILPVALSSTNYEYPTSYLRTHLDEDLDDEVDIPPYRPPPNSIHENDQDASENLHFPELDPRPGRLVRAQNLADYRPVHRAQSPAILVSRTRGEVPHHQFALRHGTRVELPYHLSAPQNDAMDPNQARLHAQADRRADRLHNWRTAQPALQDAFVTALRAWKAGNPATYTTFETLMENAALLCTSTVRAHDIMMWGQKTPVEVRTALKALTTHYHVEAVLRRALVESETRTNSWSGPNELNAEEDFAASTTSVQITTNNVKYKMHSHFGLRPGDVTLNMIDWDITHHPSRRGFLVKILAFLALSRDHLESCTTGSSPDSRMMEDAVDFIHALVLKVFNTLQPLVVTFNAPDVTSADKRYLVDTVKAAHTLRTQLDTDLRVRDILEARATTRDLLLVLAIREQDRPAGLTGPLPLTDQTVAMSSRIERAEATYGPIFGNWRVKWGR